MLTVKDRQQIMAPITEVMSQITLKELDLCYQLERWIEETIEENPFNPESQIPPTNQKLTYQNSLLNKIKIDTEGYKNYVSSSINLNTQTYTLEACLKTVTKYCDELKARMLLIDKM
jgi:hypothetical protein